jgi:hypothetical protein
MPTLTDFNERPLLDASDALTGEQVLIRFGYIDGEPVAAIYGAGDDPVMLHRDILALAAEQGWTAVCEQCAAGQPHTH